MTASKQTYRTIGTTTEKALTLCKYKTSPSDTAWCWTGIIHFMLLSSSVIVSTINSFGSAKSPSTHIEITARQPCAR